MPVRLGSGGACHALLARMSEEATPIPYPDRAAPAPPADEAPPPLPEIERRFTAEVDGRRFEVVLRSPDAAPAGNPGPAAAPGRARKGRRGGGPAPGRAGGSTETVSTPMQGTVLRVLVEQGQEVQAGDVICIVEAMKMENEVAAHQPGVVRELRVEAGQAVQADEVIAVIS